MITDLELLQHRYYSDWKRDDGCMRGPYCKFCHTFNGQPTREFHKPGCTRLEYIDYFYGVKPKKIKHGFMVTGTEFTRSDVFGWRTNLDEFKHLIKAAFEKEEKANV